MKYDEIHHDYFLQWGQDENGMYWGEVSNEFIQVKATITCRFLPELWQWWEEQKAASK